MNLFEKILSAAGVLIVGALLMAGSFWLNFGGLDLNFGPRAEIIQNGVSDPAEQIPEEVTDQKPSPEAAKVLETLPQEKPSGVAVPEKKEQKQEIVSLSANQGTVRDAESSPVGSSLTRVGIIEATNRQRQTNLGPGHALAENEFLNKAAEAKVQDMFLGQYFEHTSPSGNDAEYFIGRTGYEYIAIGENLAMGNYEGDADLVQAWMDSPGHRENILKSGFSEIGVAAAYGNFEGRRVWLAVQEFGTPTTVCPTVDENLSQLIDAQKNTLDEYTSDQEKLAAQIDMKKDVVTSLEDDFSEAAALADSYSALKKKQEELNLAINEVNALVDEYNTSVSQAKALYEQYKNDVEDYNAQVSDYNDCISKI